MKFLENGTRPQPPTSRERGHEKLYREVGETQYARERERERERERDSERERENVCMCVCVSLFDFSLCIILNRSPHPLLPPILPYSPHPPEKINGLVLFLKKKSEKKVSFSKKYYVC